METYHLITVCILIYFIAKYVHQLFGEKEIVVRERIPIIRYPKVAKSAKNKKQEVLIRKGL